ncbi:Ff.00g021900.m01.CDS01 [Fusarium sp. VM40]|nr:Ff.00g021900.m01.CDS01 [Fusarium sp. VM40]
MFVLHSWLSYQGPYFGGDGATRSHQFTGRQKQGARYNDDGGSVIHHGLGRHAKFVSTEDQIVFFKLLLAFECIYVTAVMLVKLALLQMYLRIFPSRRFRQISAIIAAVVIGWWISICAVSIFQCDPIKRAWLPWIDGTCINLKASFIGNAIPNIATDVAILCMPVKQILKLQVSLAQKLSLLVIFLLGSFVLFASIYRFTTIMQFDPTDTTWTLATACTWCVVEAACGTIALCLPTLRPLMLMVSSKFDSMPGTSTAGFGHHSNLPTELITIGGTGRTKTGQMHRILSKKDSNASQQELNPANKDIPHHDNSSDGRSADGSALRKERDDEHWIG